MRKEVEMGNKLGLYAGPAALFVRCVISSRVQEHNHDSKGEEKFSAASRAYCQLRRLSSLEAIWPDEQEAVNKLELLLLSFRDEERALS